MGRDRRGRIVTGISTVLASGGPHAAPGGGSTGPLACTVGFSAGPGPYHVSGSSGFLPGIIQGGSTGGTPPYTENYSFLSDPSGKIGGADNGTGADSITYAGFALNEVESCYLRYTVTDSLGQSATARFPTSGLLSITRTS